jgi:hypothetical protein
MTGYNSFKEIVGRVMSSFAKAIYHSKLGANIKDQKRARLQIQPMLGLQPATKTDL